MPTIGELERLSALVTRLIPLSSRTHGDLITADDWNLLVGAVLEVARAVVRDDADATVPAHEHPGQVSLGWLDPRTRALVERGGLQDPEASARLIGAEHAADVAGGRIDQLEGTLTRLRGSLDVLETNQLTQRNAIANMGRLVDGVADPREELLEFRSTLDSVREEIAASSAVVRGFGGVKPDDILRRLKDADELRASLTTPEGKVFDASEYERRLVDLRSSLVTEDELTDAIKNVGRPRDMLDKLRPIVIEESRLAAAAASESAVAGATDSLRADFREELATARGELDAEGGRIRGELAAQSEGLHLELETRSNELGDRLTAQADELRSQVETVRTELAAGVEQIVDQRATAILDDRIASLAERLTGLGSRLDSVEGRFGDLDTRLGSRFDEMDRRLATRLDQLDGTIRERDQVIDGLRTSIPQDVVRLVGESSATLETNLRAEIDKVAVSQKSLGTDLRRAISVERRRVDGLNPDAPP